MSKVILHIGTHKTATTTVQDMFSANAKLLETHGLIYPRLGSATGHHGLVFDWGHLPKVYAYPSGSLATLREIADEYGRTDATVFLSSEEFSRADPHAAPDLTAIRGALSAFDEIEVICVLRPQWQFLQSVYLELSKKGNPPRPPTLVAPVIGSGMYTGLNVDYNLLLDRLETAFRPEEITFLEFEACREAPGGIIGALLRHLGIALEAGALEQINDGSSNVSPPPLAGFVANILAEPKVAPDWLRQYADEALSNDFGADNVSCLFTRQEFQRLKTHFDARNALLCKRRVPVQPNFTIPEASMAGLTLFRDDITATFWLRIGRRMVHDRL